MGGVCQPRTTTSVSSSLAVAERSSGILSGVLGFTPRQMREIHQKVEEMRAESDEDSFEYSIGCKRLRLSGIETHHIDGTVTDDDSDNDKAEVAKWWKDHPGRAVCTVSGGHGERLCAQSSTRQGSQLQARRQSVGCRYPGAPTTHEPDRIEGE